MLKKAWKVIAAFLGILVGVVVGYFAVKARRAQILEEAKRKIAPIAPAMEVEEYRAKVQEKAVELGKQEIEEVMAAWTKRFGG